MKLRLALALGLAALLTVAFGALSAWQWQRLGWKLALIDRVERQLAAAPVAAPAPAAWPALTREADEYRRVTLRGRFDGAHEALVLASTELGRGHWLLVPLVTAEGWRVWVNRGFVDDAHRAPATHPVPEGEQSVSGLLRWTEPRGLLWQTNDPAAGRWFSRDVAALSAAAGLPVATTAPYFVDVDASAGAGAVAGAGAHAGADATAGTDGFPRGGLTVVRFSNNHAVYALTWLALALGAAAAGVWVGRSERRRRAGPGGPG